MIARIALAWLAWAGTARADEPEAEEVPLDEVAAEAPAEEEAGPLDGETLPPLPEEVVAAAVAAPAKPADVHRVRARLGERGYVETWGHLREIATIFPDFAVDAEGGRVGQRWLVDQRLRTGLALGTEGIRLATEWDLLTGNLGGDTWDIPGGVDPRGRDTLGQVATLDGQVPRRASLSLDIDRWMLIDAGLMPAHKWGLGILANGGESETLFGRVDRGDRMLRFRSTLAPFRAGGQLVPLFVTFAFDRVVEDDTARWSAGQEAYHVIGSLLWAMPSGLRVGAFYTWRSQREPGAAPRPTDVHALDLYADVPVQLGADWSLRLAAEGALLVGRTERVLHYAHRDDGTRIRSGGLAAEIDVRSPQDRFSVHLRGGYASSSGDPDRGVMHDFGFDPNYNVGLVLFDELQGAIEAGTYALLADPANAGRPPDGAELLATGGAVRRATYVFPILRTRPTGWLDVRAGYLAAWSTGPIAQPFYTFRAGGSPRNHLDEPTGDRRFLGHELDVAVELGGGAATAAWPVRPSLRLEAGVGWPGAAMGGGTLVLGRAVVRAEW